MNNLLRISLAAIMVMTMTRLSAQNTVPDHTPTEAANAMKISVDDLILTLKGPVGQEVTISVGVWDEEDYFDVDFGDGNLQSAMVGIGNNGPAQGDGTATTFKGTVSGDGTIRVYCMNDIWYLNLSGGVVPYSFNQPKLMKVVQMNITDAPVEKVELPAYGQLKYFAFNNSPIKSIDVTKVPSLTSLTINNTTSSKYEPQLESIDLSKNVNLESLSITGNQNTSGKLKSLDLSKNTKLKGSGLYVQYNALKTLTLPATNELTLINVQNNQLTTLALDKLPQLKSLYASNNQLEGVIDLTKYESLDHVRLDGNQLTGIKVKDVTRTFYIDGNKLTLATIPPQPASMNTKSKTNNYRYAPQAPLQVAATVTELDLSDQLTVAQGELNSNDGYSSYLSGTTTYSLVTASGTTLVEGTDYKVVAPGKFKFLKERSDKIHVVMLNNALPKFTADAPFVTTEFTIPSTVGITEVSDTPVGKLYNLQGMEVTNARKGLYIQNGKKVIIK